MVDGFGHGARVVTAAAVIMIAVFSGFILSSETLVREIGFGLALAVAIDAFVVRMTIVPAVMALLGRSAWWLPRWLDRLLPDVDVEGEKLRRQLEPAVPEPREPELAIAVPGPHSRARCLSQALPSLAVTGRRWVTAATDSDGCGLDDGRACSAR